MFSNWLVHIDISVSINQQNQTSALYGYWLPSRELTQSNGWYGQRERERRGREREREESVLLRRLDDDIFIWSTFLFSFLFCFFFLLFIRLFDWMVGCCYIFSGPGYYFLFSLFSLPNSFLLLYIFFLF